MITKNFLNTLFVSLTILLFSSAVYAQNEVGKIAFSLLMPNEIDHFDQNSLTKLETKILDATTNVGIAGKGFYSDFVLYPVVSFNEMESQSQTMKNMVSVSLDLGLYIKSVSDGRIYASFTQTLVGVGTSKNNALTNALNDFNTKSKNISDFFINAATKITNYFNEKCDDFISKADALSKMGRYDEAIALLMSIPNISQGCYNKVKSKAVETYKLHMNKNCNETMLLANSKKAIGDYSLALSTLTLIDPTTSCYKEAKEIITKIEQEIKNQRQKDEAETAKLIASEVELEKYRMNSIKEIALAYYAKEPVTYNYYDIVMKK
jgi:hypothetical protein